MAQSRMEIARISIQFADGSTQLAPIRNQETISDWIWRIDATASGARSQRLGHGAKGVLHEIDLGETREIKSVILETRTNETMVGLLGITVMQEKE